MSDFKGRHFRGEIVLWAVRLVLPVSDRLPRPRSDDDRARRRGRPLHDLSLGAAFRAGDGETSAPAVAPAAVAELARRRDLHQGPRQVGVSAPGGGQAREHDRFLPLGDPQHQGSEAISRQGAERIERVGAARSAQHRQGAGLCRCHRGAEGRGQVPEGHEAQAGEIPQQRHRGRPRQAQAADPARARVQDAEDGLRHDQGLRGDARAAQGPGRMFALQGGIVGEARIIERAFGLGPCALTEAVALLQDRLANAET